MNRVSTLRMCGFVVLVGVMLGMASHQPVLGDFLDKVVGVRWGPASHNLKFGFTVPASVSSGEALLVQLYLKNDGPLIVITRIGVPREYNVVVRSSNGQVVPEKPGAFYPYVISGGQHPYLKNGTIYHTSFDLRYAYDLQPGIYRVDISTDVYPNLLTRTTPKLTTLVGSSCQVVVH